MNNSVIFSDLEHGGEVGGGEHLREMKVVHDPVSSPWDVSLREERIFVGGSFGLEESYSTDTEPPEGALTCRDWEAVIHLFM